jgi:hypothetical protein
LLRSASIIPVLCASTLLLCTEGLVALRSAFSERVSLGCVMTSRQLLLGLSLTTGRVAVFVGVEERSACRLYELSQAHDEISVCEIRVCILGTTHVAPEPSERGQNYKYVSVASNEESVTSYRRLECHEVTAP